MVTINENEAPAQTFPGELSDSVDRGGESTVAVSSEEDSEPTGAPMLDALRTYREEQLK